MQKRAAGALAGAAGLPQQKRQRTDELTRVFVGSLAYSTNWQNLKDHFAQVGEVEFASVLLKPDGQSKGCGMVNYRLPEEAALAVEQLNESMLDGRRIMVKLDLAVDNKRPAPTPGLGGLGQARSAGEFEAARAPRVAQRPAVQDEGVHLPPEAISRVFVGNLSFSTTWQGLKDHFKTAGNVEFASILENPDKTSKGVGLVNYITHDEAVMAVDMLNESVLDGRNISVKLDVDGKFKARPPPKSQQPPPVAEDAFVYRLPVEEISRVFVGNLSYSTNWQSLKDHFSQVGEIEFASVLLNPDRTSKGVGMVNFRNHEEAVRAVEQLGNSLLDGRNIMVKLDVDGHFKERPPPGARPRVFQKTKEATAAPAAGGAGGQVQQALATAQVLTQALTQAGYAASPSQRPPPSSARQGAQASSPAATTLECLTALGRLAQSPVAGQIDWPSLISSVASTVGNVQGGGGGGGKGGGGAPRQFLR